MTPNPFLSPEPASLIEPAEFLAHLLPQHGTGTATVDMRAVVLLTFIPALQHRLMRNLDMPPPQPQRIARQAWYNPDGRPFSTLSSPVGAPMAVMLLEQLIALGARRFLYLGFCGALDPTLSIGDLFIPLRAVREEGTSYHYLPAGVEPEAAPSITTLIKEEAARLHLDVRQGPLCYYRRAVPRNASENSRFSSRRGAGGGHGDFGPPVGGSLPRLRGGGPSCGLRRVLSPGMAHRIRGARNAFRMPEGCCTGARGGGPAR